MSINHDVDNVRLNWNYRVLKITDEVTTYFKIIEVYYNKDGIWRWVDCTETILICPTIEDLKGTTEYVLSAFEMPLLVIGEGGNLISEDGTSLQTTRNTIVEEDEHTALDLDQIIVNGILKEIGELPREQQVELFAKLALKLQ